jgi:RNA polymerase sigma-70 factor (ECF subfamily)
MDARERQAALERARAGDAGALAELLESFRPYVRVIARAFHDERLQGRFDVSDLIQDGLLEAHRSFAEFRGTTVAELLVWLRQIVVRSAARTRRGFLDTGKRDPGREQAVADLHALPLDGGSSPSAQAIRQEQGERVAAALARLPLDMQQVLLLRHVDGLAHADIALRLGRTESAVRMLYLRALRRLREIYRE